MTNWMTQLERTGFAVIPAALPEHLREPLLALFAEEGSKAGSRHALDHNPVRKLARSEVIRCTALAALGAPAFAIRANLFDKTPSSNWLVAWHQDTMIPLREKRDVPGFTAWSQKGGVQHGLAPAHVLESMVTIRIHLDECDDESGPLRVIPGSHLHGVVTSAEIQELKTQTLAISCHVPAGGALVMRPLLLHASSKASSPGHRRVVHLEFSATDLPGGLEWHARTTQDDSMHQADAAGPDQSSSDLRIT